MLAEIERKEMREKLNRVLILLTFIYLAIRIIRGVYEEIVGGW